MFIAALCVNAQKQKQHKWPPSDKLKNKIWYCISIQLNIIHP